MADIDHFKRVNDGYGHLSGDDVLIEFAALLSSSIRKIDVLGHWSGEEFMIICPETAKDNAVILAEKLRQLVATHEFKHVGTCTASFGVSELTAGDTIVTMLSRVDHALYAAKERAVIGLKSNRWC